MPTLAIIRQTSYAQAFFLLYFMTIERSVFWTIFDWKRMFRFCATIFVRDYEQEKRLYISAVLCTVITASSFVTGYVIVTGVIIDLWLRFIDFRNCKFIKFAGMANGIIVSALALLPNIFCAIVSWSWANLKPQDSLRVLWDHNVEGCRPAQSGRRDSNEPGNSVKECQYEKSLHSPTL